MDKLGFRSDCKKEKMEHISTTFFALAGVDFVQLTVPCNPTSVSVQIPVLTLEQILEGAKKRGIQLSLSPEGDTRDRLAEDLSVSDLPEGEWYMKVFRHIYNWWRWRRATKYLRKLERREASNGWYRNAMEIRKERLELRNDFGLPHAREDSYSTTPHPDEGFEKALERLDKAAFEYGKCCAGDTDDVKARCDVECDEVMLAVKALRSAHQSLISLSKE